MAVDTPGRASDFLVMAEGSADTSNNVANHTLKQLQGMRRDYAALIDRQSLMMKAIIDLKQAVELYGRETRDGFQSVRSDIQAVKSDIVTLESQNFSRHGELLNVMRRLDEFGFPADADLP